MEWLLANIIPLVVVAITAAGAWMAIRISVASLAVRLKAAEDTLLSRSEILETSAVHSTRIEHIENRLRSMDQEHLLLAGYMEKLGESMSELGIKASVSEKTTERLVTTLDKLDGTLSRINDTVISLEVRVNHLEEAKK